MTPISYTCLYYVTVTLALTQQLSNINVQINYIISPFLESTDVI